MNNDNKKHNIATYYKKKASLKYTNNYYNENEKLKHIINTYIPLIKNDIMYKIVHNLANRCSSLINIKDYKLTHNELIGCTHEELKNYLENKFECGMNFNNYGEWELDHIYPVSKFNLNDINDVKKCFNYKNIQPLWMSENRSKSNKINPSSVSVAN